MDLILHCNWSFHSQARPVIGYTLHFMLTQWPFAVHLDLHWFKQSCSLKGPLLKGAEVIGCPIAMRYAESRGRVGSTNVMVT